MTYREKEIIVSKANGAIEKMRKCLTDEEKKALGKAYSLSCSPEYGHTEYPLPVGKNGIVPGSIELEPALVVFIEGPDGLPTYGIGDDKWHIVTYGTNGKGPHGSYLTKEEATEALKKEAKCSGKTGYTG